MRVSFLALAVLSAVACYKPDYAANPDAGIGFRCHKSDNPPCPSNFVCCLNGLCGDDLNDTDEGWCVPPSPPADMSVLGVNYWPFPSKPFSQYFSGVYMPAQLTGYDSNMHWLCTRDDTNPNPSDMIRHMGEPNDLPGEAIVLPNPLPVDLPPTAMGSSYQICPDKTAPSIPDVDAYKFTLMSPAKVIAEIKYSVVQGDLDIFVFRMDLNENTNQMMPTLVAQDMTGVDNGCVSMPSLEAGSYFVVVKGVGISPDMPNSYTMNNYALRVQTINQSTYSCQSGQQDMGP